jgi:hypothetical protein
VLPIPKVCSHAGFSDFRPISLLSCLSKVCEVLMAVQMKGHIRNFGLLCPFQSGFRRQSQYYNSSLKGDGGHSIEFRRRASDCFGHYW